MNKSSVQRRPGVSVVLFICSFALAAIPLSCAKFLYQPNSYSQKDLEPLHLWSGAEELFYHTDQGRQVAFYLPPKDGRAGPPHRVWIFFGGISHKALEWVQWLRNYPEQGTAFLLMEYPGYGKSEGRSNAKRINQSAHTALQALAESLELSQESLEERLGILGHSLGTGTALNFATGVAARRIVLVAPFTTMRALTTHRFGPLLGSMLNLINPEKYNNYERLVELSQREAIPLVSILHGAVDNVIPAQMGRDLASAFPSFVKYQEIGGQGHQDFFKNHMAAVASEMVDW